MLILVLLFLLFYGIIASLAINVISMEFCFFYFSGGPIYKIFSIITEIFGYVLESSFISKIKLHNILHFGTL